MSIFELTDSIALSIVCAKKYNYCAFDGCFYYFTVKCSCEIIKTDCHFCVEECYNTRREYDCICYDPEYQCFWATTTKYNHTIFQLNCNMCEIDYITIQDFDDFAGDITGISYNCCTNELVLSFSNCIIKTNKQTGHSDLLYATDNFQITSVLSLCPGLIISGTYNNSQYVFILDSDGTVKYTQPISNELIIKNILFNPCLNEELDYLDFFVLKKGCYPYIYRYELNIVKLPFTPDECNFNLCSEDCCEQESPIEGCYEEETLSEDCCEQVNTEESCASVLHSIALIETEIAHILNCQGEKLQKIMEENTDIEVILNANKEVNKTISNVSQLEYLLYLKLNALIERELCNDITPEDETSHDTTSTEETHLIEEKIPTNQANSLQPENTPDSQKIAVDNPTKIKYGKGLKNDASASITNTSKP